MPVLTGARAGRALTKAEVRRHGPDSNACRSNEVQRSKVFLVDRLAPEPGHPPLTLE